MARCTLERTILALEAFASILVRVVTTVVLVIATPPARDTLAIVAAELRLGTFAIFALALGFTLVATITAIIRKVTHPLSRYTTIIVALEVGLQIALWAVLRQLVALIPTIVLTVTEQPFRNATIVGLTRTA